MTVVRLGWHNGKNGSRRWASVERGDEMMETKVD
jgi:hypothetical protein